VISFVAAGLGVALLSERLKRLPHEGVIFRPLTQLSLLSANFGNFSGFATPEAA
jgi:hypothetical protein